MKFFYVSILFLTTFANAHPTTAQENPVGQENTSATEVPAPTPDVPAPTLDTPAPTLDTPAPTPDVQSGAVFTLVAGLNIMFRNSDAGGLKPGPNISGDLVGVVDTGSIFKIGLGAVSDYTMFFDQFNNETGVFAAYTIGGILKPMLRIGKKTYWVNEIGLGYSIKHSYGSASSLTKSALGLIAGMGMSISRFVFGGRYRLCYDDLETLNWVSIYIGVAL